MSNEMIYTRFERLWHWALALLIVPLLVTGFEIHGTYHWLGFEKAVDTHIVFAWILMGLLVFVIFWHMTTGEWKQYIPESKSKLMAMVRYYMIDIFMGGGHPFHQSRASKLNPLQRLAYLSLHLLITPVTWVSGLLYLFYPSWADWGLEWGSLTVVALVHVAAAFAMLAFLIVHLYLAITTSEKPFGYVKAMITGHEH
ncbi:MAG: cytochrome b/b6 domain-containing protein [Desulfobacter sp.]|nr:cytochrome b/b6 domain-containing protein [Desulfobacter sp.]